MKLTEINRKNKVEKSKNLKAGDNGYRSRDFNVAWICGQQDAAYKSVGTIEEDIELTGSKVAGVVVAADAEKMFGTGALVDQTTSLTSCVRCLSP
ncbi:hypothetical protein FNV43_RR00023 [Rhamnella rubrinervis]|uniref:Uncharacterized protein n=1 Tax=Rhamnella rubrinervis TaxID=2594499 RepID=A0A8K0HPU2_9ROSA|nr:hypothetical protein FNV43_RR00023 [Rhamnella rubrinervis]